MIPMIERVQREGLRGGRERECREWGGREMEGKRPGGQASRRKTRYNQIA